MFAIHWTKRTLEYLTSTDDHRTDLELSGAYTNARNVVDSLEKWRKRLERWPCYSYEVRLIDEVLQALRDDHGGVLPFELFSVWSKNRSEQERSFGNGPEIFATPNHKSAMIRALEQWTGEGVKQQFWTLKINDLDDDLLCFHTPGVLPEKRVLEVGRCLEVWLQTRKAG